MSGTQPDEIPQQIRTRFPKLTRNRKLPANKVLSVKRGSPVWTLTGSKMFDD